MRYQIGALEFDPVSGELVIGDRRERLAPQPAAALRLLLERPGEMVRRDEFMAAIWPGEAFGVSERLTYCLHQLRRTLTELGMPDAIETVPRRGYRCRIDTPVVIDEAPPSHDMMDAVVAPPRTRSWRPTIAAGIAALILLAIGFRSGRGAQADAATVTASNAPGASHDERHAARHAVQHVVR